MVQPPDEKMEVSSKQHRKILLGAQGGISRSPSVVQPRFDESLNREYELNRESTLVARSGLNPSRWKTLRNLRLERTGSCRKGSFWATLYRDSSD